jgi:S-adenosyl methyltransferase
MFVASLHHVSDEDDPAAAVGRYLDAVAPGSYLVLSHCTDDVATEGMRQGSAAARERGVTFVPRSHAGVLRLFNGRDLIEPGLVQVTYWRPDRPDMNADLAFAYGGVASLT